MALLFFVITWNISFQVSLKKIHNLTGIKIANDDIV